MIKRKLFAGKRIFSLGLLLLVGFTTPHPNQEAEADVAAHAVVQATDLEGAWRLIDPVEIEQAAIPNATAVKIIEDGLFSVAYYDETGKKFLGTYGGTYEVSRGNISMTYEFNTFDSTAVGKTATGAYTILNDKLGIEGIKGAQATETWEKIPVNNDASPLAGAWRIRARERDGQMSPMNPGPRKTIKMLSDNRFQWIAFNSETAGFFGTGGGTYTTENGKYTENIEFFSRDSSRVGQQLSFDFDVKEGDWHHSGLSSTGNKINEVWHRQNNQ
ncbi:membrane or secreted protein [Pontibacter diazotrophicus]|uniref:membrane or secreted protein n=1 Tax=Pontibacter diazotrophicus TaxID=1400979 RepID=UPI0015F13FD7|nr:membrane or secreted protein [Pontibacter diazotrophicus]